MTNPNVQWSPVIAYSVYVDFRFMPVFILFKWIFDLYERRAEKFDLSGVDCIQSRIYKLAVKIFNCEILIEPFDKLR